MINNNINNQPNAVLKFVADGFYLQTSKPYQQLFHNTLNLHSKFTSSKQQIEKIPRIRVSTDTNF